MAADSNVQMAPLKRTGPVVPGGSNVALEGDFFVSLFHFEVLKHLLSIHISISEGLQADQKPQSQL